ncbi:MAG: caspase family protein, partial [Desulfobacteraceae bacterium]|nr:caspase family protein [Desulfobacteraceae bacterium]
MECRKNEERMKPLFGVQVILCFLVAVYLIIFTAVPLYGTDRYRGIKRKTDFSHKSGKIGKYTALIIGIDDYADKKIPDLKTAGADADAVAKVLKERYGFKDITVLKDRQATKSAIIRAFR